MITVPEAARRTGRNPETIRRWIRAGKLRARKIGTQHVIDERDLAEVLEPRGAGRVPRGWTTTWTGDPMPDWVALVREARDAR